MSITPIAAIAASAAPAVATQTTAEGKADGASFAQWVTGQVLSTDQKIKHADLAMRDLAVGQTDNLHQVMMDIESARLSLDLVIQVRNRVIEAYQDTMRIQL